MRVVDLRSDVLGSPTEAMWEAMRTAEVGWALVHEDESVARLEALGARLLGKEASLFTPTCGMANLVGLMTLGERGTQVILERRAHIASGEAWGMAYVCGLFAHALDTTDGILAAEAVEHALAQADAPGTSLLVLENTHTRAGGVAMSPTQTATLAALAHAHSARVHLDGARLLNAAAAFGVEAHELTRSVDTVSLSLNKGLGAPMGALLAGSHEAISLARLHLKRLGGASIHQAGLMAAAGIVALETELPTLAADNRTAAELTARLSALPAARVEAVTVRTNIVTLDLSGCRVPADRFVALLREHAVRAYPRGAHHVRFVTHRGIREAEVERVVVAVGAVLGDVRTAV